MSAANWGIFWGGGLNIFFRGRNVHQEMLYSPVFNYFIHILILELIRIRHYTTVTEQKNWNSLELRNS